MSTRREQDAWLPEPVQRIANAAVRCGLVPLVEVRFGDESISLRDEHDGEVAVVAMVGPGVVLHYGDEDGSVTIAGTARILAWMTRRTGCLAR